MPYSLVTATDLDLVGVGDGGPNAADGASAAAPAPIVLNEWLARDLGAAAGDSIDVDYYLWDASQGLTTHTASFRVAAVIPIAGFAADRGLVPEYPGITAAKHLADWDPPFPIDLERVRPIDEKYWDEYRTTPKAFIRYEDGRKLWQTRYGAATSFRLRAASADAAAEATAAIAGAARGDACRPRRWASP